MSVSVLFFCFWSYPLLSKQRGFPVTWLLIPDWVCSLERLVREGERGKASLRANGPRGQGCQRNGGSGGNIVHVKGHWRIRMKSLTGRERLQHNKG
uniref:Secreted protein n=1 Tax=Monopterus albus TaxID=43700 RepID=A0A3Q3K891_MONAL